MSCLDTSACKVACQKDICSDQPNSCVIAQKWGFQAPLETYGEWEKC